MLVSRILFIIQTLDKGRTLEVHHLSYRRPTGSDLKDNLITLTAAVEARTMAIARGELKPKPGDPKVWFTGLPRHGDASGFTSGTGRVYWPQGIQSVPDVEDDGALWLRAATS